MGKRIQKHESNRTIVFFDECNKVVDGQDSSIFKEEIDHFNLISCFNILTGRGERLPQDFIIIFEETVLPWVYPSNCIDCIKDFIKSEEFGDGNVF